MAQPFHLVTEQPQDSGWRRQMSRAPENQRPEEPSEREVIQSTYRRCFRREQRLRPLARVVQSRPVVYGTTIGSAGFPCL